MKMGQQKQIKAFLAERFGPEKGQLLFIRQQKRFQTLMQENKNKSFAQRCILARQVLPCIALYQVLLKSNLSAQDAYQCTQSYMVNYVAAKQHASTAKMERVPGFYALYSRIFLTVTQTKDLWTSTRTRSSNCFDVTITKCLWHTTCAENGCAQLCRLFCDTDNITYGGLRKIGFTRTQALGYGGECCDFHFYKK